MSDERYDWDSIELDYRAGILSVNAICTKHGCSPSRLASVAQERGWTRLPPPRAEELFPLASNGHFALPLPDESTFTPEEIKRHMLLSVATVTNTHKRDIAKLRGTSYLLAERLQLVLMGEQVTLPCLGGRESPADLLEKLSRVLVRCVQLERQAYNLEAMSQNPGGDGSDTTVVAMNDEIKALRDMVENVASTKAKTANQGETSATVKERKSA